MGRPHLLFATHGSLPWTKRRRGESEPSQGLELPAAEDQPVVNIIQDRCTGCTVCALDCPYGAIEMVERTDGKRHKYIAIEDPGLCVSCGICVGSCDGVAVTMGQTPPSVMWDTVAAQLALAKLRSPIDEVQVVFTCERHAVHGGRPYLDRRIEKQNGSSIEVVELPCVGILPPDLLARTIDEGVANVHIIGCPADDCANREGNVWLEQRITRERVPRLKRPYANVPITASWLPPDDFDRGIAAIPTKIEKGSGEKQEIDYMAMRQMVVDLSWRNYLVAFFLLALVMVVQILLTDLPFTPYPERSAAGQIVISDLAAPIGRTSYISSTLGPTLDLLLEINGEVILVDTFESSAILSSEAYPFFDEFDLAAGNQEIRLLLHDPGSATSFVLFDAPVKVSERDILTIPIPLE